MQAHVLIPLKDLLKDLPELARAQLNEAWRNGEFLMEPQRGSSVIRTRSALLELARALYGMEHHTPQKDRSKLCDSPEAACAHANRLRTARQDYILACLDTAPVKP